VNLPKENYWQPSDNDDRSANKDYLLFDVAENSELEPISTKHSEFRVTMYDPKALVHTHQAGKHQYLVAREPIEADVVINIPKLKTHKKAGMTGAIKSMVGINGHKKFLPHHRKGGTGSAGDCYAGRDFLKKVAEDLYDVANTIHRPRMRRLLFRIASKAIALASVLHKDGRQAEGSWYGNDTIWRTCLDLQKILHYGGHDGRLMNTQQRRILTITDAIVAGEGDGPLSPNPVPLGVVTLSANVAAADMVHTYLMGLDPERIPLVRQAFKMTSHRIADLQPEDVVLNADGQQISLKDAMCKYGRRFQPPSGWAGHCELQEKG
jgi:uncharacterized protein (DUF362 family)